MSVRQFEEGRWSKEEHQRFVKALSLYDRNWKKVEEYVQTRSCSQIRSHAQKYFNKIYKGVSFRKTDQKQKLKDDDKTKQQNINNESISNHSEDKDEEQSQNSKDELAYQGQDKHKFSISSQDDLTPVTKAQSSEIELVLCDNHTEEEDQNQSTQVSKDNDSPKKENKNDQQRQFMNPYFYQPQVWYGGYMGYYPTTNYSQQMLVNEEHVKKQQQKNIKKKQKMSNNNHIKQQIEQKTIKLGSFNIYNSKNVEQQKQKILNFKRLFSQINTERNDTIKQQEQEQQQKIQCV